MKYLHRFHFPICLALFLALALLIVGSTASAAAPETLIHVEALAQRLVRPVWTGQAWDNGTYDCLPASVAMAIDALQKEKKIPGQLHDGGVTSTLGAQQVHPVVRQAFRREFPNVNAGIDPAAAVNLVPQLTDGILDAAIVFVDPDHWQEFIAQQLQAGYPVIAIMMDWKLPSVTPEQRTIHAIVISGWRSGYVNYNDPWDGNAYQITADEFGKAWGTASPGTEYRWVAISYLPHTGSSPLSPAQNKPIFTNIQTPTVSTPQPKGIALQLLSVTATGPTNGWKSYQAELAIRNKGQGSIQITLPDCGSYNTYPRYPTSPYSGLPTVDFQYGSSFVETKEGPTYPVTIKLPQTDYGDTAWPSAHVIPGGLGVSDAPYSNQRWFAQAPTAEFQVPELLHPSRLVVAPGTSFGTTPGPLTLDLSGSPSQRPLVNTATTSNVLSAHLSTGLGDIALTIGSVSKAEVSRDYWLPDGDGYLSLTIPFTITNNNITGNRAVNLQLLLLDSSGSMYRPEGGLPAQVGPGQTVTGRALFYLPGSVVLGPRNLYLTAVGGNVDTTYEFDVAQLDNCVQANKLPSTTNMRGADEQTIEQPSFTIPGSVSGSIGAGEGTAHYQFVGRAGQIINNRYFPSGECLVD